MAKSTNSKPISLSPLTFEKALKGLLAVDPKAVKSPEKAASRKKAVSVPKKKPRRQ